MTPKTQGLQQNYSTVYPKSTASKGEEQNSTYEYDNKVSKKVTIL
jgi:hypothetical protein